MSEPTRIHDATAERHLPLQMALGVLAVAERVRALAADATVQVDGRHPDADGLDATGLFASALLGVLAVDARLRAAAALPPDPPPARPRDDASWLR